MTGVVSSSVQRHDCGVGVAAEAEGLRALFFERRGHSCMARPRVAPHGDRRGARKHLAESLRHRTFVAPTLTDVRPELRSKLRLPSCERRVARGIART